MLYSKKDPTGPTERTPKPEYLIARSQLTERGPLGFGPIQFLMDLYNFSKSVHDVTPQVNIHINTHHTTH